MIIFALTSGGLSSTFSAVFATIQQYATPQFLVQNLCGKLLFLEKNPPY